MKTRIISTALMTAMLTLMVSFATIAQDNEKRFGFELNGGASFATSQPGETSLNTGFGFEGIFHYRFLKHTGVYAGWGWNKFAAESSFAGADIDFEETGYVFGLQFKHPLGSGAISYYLRVGGLYNHLELENENGDIIGDTGHGLGYQLAGGVDIPLGKKWNLTPGIKFNSLSRELEQEGTTTQLEHNYLSIRLGLLKKF